MEDMIEFQRQQIEALQNEIERLKMKIIETEKNTRISANELKDFINDPVFSRPIQELKN